MSIPLQLLHKYKNDAFKLEALFYGQANLLGAKVERAMVLNIEYRYLAKLHQLTPIKNAPLFLRLRPVSFPTIRLAQFITLIIQSKHLFSKLMLSFEAKDVKPYFDLEISDFWKEHYDFGKKFKKKISGKLGQSTIDAITINTIVPFVYLYDQLHHPDSDRFSSFLEQIKPEHNSKINLLTETLGLHNTTAYDSQSLLEWYDGYCTEKKCLDCIIGYHTLSN